MRALARVIAMGALVLSAGCPDPCVFLGGGCNNNDDCRAGELCRKSREFEAGCSLVEGRCIAFVDDNDVKRCGSVDDCDEGECCDPRTDTCIGEAGYTSLDCDDDTCEDCDDTAFGDRCELSGDCDTDESCSADSANSFDSIDTRGVCRPSCEDNDDCPADQRCSSDGCSVSIGTSCVVLDGADSSSFDNQCLGLDCTTLDAADERGNDGYCTGFCSSVDGFESCPTGFVCDEDTLECRRF